MKFRDFTKYEVFEDGRIYSYKSKKFLKPGTVRGGYKQVHLTDNEGKAKMYYLHRVVWEAVTREPIPKGYEINHISEDKDENVITNLELVTPKQNCNWGSRNTRIGKSNTNNPKLSKAVGAFKDEKLVMVFPSTNEAGRNGFDKGAVSKCCNGKWTHYKGFEWKYI